MMWRRQNDVNLRYGMLESRPIPRAYNVSLYFVEATGAVICQYT